jgi:RNA polymerase sigma factor (sigma-70 family)
MSTSGRWPTEKELVDAVLAGEPGAGEELFGRYDPVVQKATKRFASSWDEAQDLRQEGWLHLWSRLDRWSCVPEDRRVKGTPDREGEEPQRQPAGESSAGCKRSARESDQWIPLSGWIATVVANRCLDIKRAERKKREFISLGDLLILGSEAADDGANPEAAALESVLLEDVKSCLSKLSDKERVLVLLRLAGFSNGDIALILGISEGQVGTGLFRARRKLRECLRSRYPDLF